MASSTPQICENLRARGELESYANSVRLATEDWNTTVKACPGAVCGALLGGRGNPDISGIGVSFRYPMLLLLKVAKRLGVNRI